MPSLRRSAYLNVGMCLLLEYVKCAIDIMFIYDHNESSEEEADENAQNQYVHSKNSSIFLSSFSFIFFSFPEKHFLVFRTCGWRRFLLLLAK